MKKVFFFLFLLLCFLFFSLLVWAKDPIPGVVANDADEQMTWSDKELQRFVNRVCVELDGPAHNKIKRSIAELQRKRSEAIDPMLILKAADLPQAEIDAFKKLDPNKSTDQKKREEIVLNALRKIAEKPAPVVLDYNSPEAQAAYKAWAEKNAGALGALLEAYLKENGYVKKEDLAKVKTDLLDLSTRFGEVANITNANTADLVQLHQTYVWQEVEGSEGRNIQVPVFIQPDMVPENFQKAVGEIASVKSSLDKKADRAEVSALSTKVDKLGTKVDSVREAVAVFALGKKDRALVYIYASFVQEGNEAGFKNFLKKQGKEKLFEEIKKEAEDASKKGYIKLTPQ